MARGFLVAGTIIQRAGETLRLTRLVEDQLWQMENTASYRVFETTTHELLEGIRSHAIRIIFNPDSGQSNSSRNVKNTAKCRWDTMPENYRATATIRLKYVKAAITLARTRSTIEPVIRDLAAKLQDLDRPSVSTVISWINNYISSGHDICALAPKYHRRGRKSQFAPEIDRIIDQKIEQHYLTKERNTLVETHELIAAEIEKHNLQICAGDNKLGIPSLLHVRTRLRKHTPFDICCARFGKEYAARKYMTVLGYAQADAPLERVEIDHTILDLMAICNETALPLGRPTLTLAIDVSTRCIVGYYLGFEPPSYLAVTRCLTHAMLPKTYVKHEYPEIENIWDCYGAMENLVVDNGLEFHAKALEEAAARFGITIQYCPRATPQFKGTVERTIGTMVRGVAHGKPGTTFSNIFERADYDPTKTACITLRALHKIIHTWIIDYYHQRVHSTTHKRPSTAWLEGTNGMPIPLPVDIEEFEAAFAIPDERTLDKNGIRLHGLNYNGAELTRIRLEHGAKLSVRIRYLPDDLGYIYVEDPSTGEVAKVPVVIRHHEYADGLSLYQHRVCRKFAASQYESNDIAALGRAKQRIADIVSTAINNKKLTKHATRYRVAGRKPMSQDTSTPSDHLNAPSTPRESRRVLENAPTINQTPAGILHTPKMSIPMAMVPRGIPKQINVVLNNAPGEVK